MFHRPGGQGLLDFTLLHSDAWRPVFIDDPFAPQLLEILPEEFTPLTGIGRVIWVESEGDQLISAGTSAQLRRAVVGPDADPAHYRLYEIAGAPHFSGTPDDPLPPPFNPLALDLAGVVRAMFLAGDQWVHAGTPPPPSVLLASAAPGTIDPVYGFETGIARDANLNALGGIRFPDVEVGRARFIASLVDSRPSGHSGWSASGSICNAFLWATGHPASRTMAITSAASSTRPTHYATAVISWRPTPRPSSSRPPNPKSESRAPARSKFTRQNPQVRDQPSRQTRGGVVVVEKSSLGGRRAPPSNVHHL